MAAARCHLVRLVIFAAVALTAEAQSGNGQSGAADYFAVPACRVYDTRTPVSDPLHGGTDRRREIQVSGVCGIPAEAVAAAVTLTALNASRPGSLALYDADLASAPMPYSSLVLPAGRVRSSNAVVEISADGKIAAELSAEFGAATDTADLVVDLLGYFLESPIRIVKLTNGQDANAPPGPSIPAGSPVLWEYVVTNLGDVALSDVSVTDSRSVAVSCPKTSLQAGESMTCTGNGLAQACQYSNVGTVTAKTPAGETVSDDDTSHYFGTIQPSIAIAKSTNGFAADTPPGPEIQVGSPVSWVYRVSNTGNSPLTNIKVTDSKGVAVSCPKTSLQPGESMTCTAQGTAIACQYGNIGTVTATTKCGSQLTAEDPSHYFGIPCP